MTVNVTNAVGANNTIVLDGSSKIPAFDGSLVTALVATAFTTGTLATARIDVGTTAGKILQLDGSARIPALSGANLVNAPGPTSSTSDPTISSNLTLGAKWINKTSGEVYICTDATAGANVWTNVGAGSGNVNPWLFQGTTYGYLAGGASNKNVIQRHSFTSDSNAVDVGDLSTGVSLPSAQKSMTHGYTTAGYTSAYDNLIMKYAFAASSSGSEIGDITHLTSMTTGASSSTHGYATGGYTTTGPPAETTTTNIEKFSTSTDGNSVDAADLTQARYAGGSQSSTTYGYHSAGELIPGGSASVNTIDKWPFASDANATDVGNVTVSRGSVGSSNSLTYGYTVGGRLPSSDVIDKFPFASDTNATDVGNLWSGNRFGFAGGSSSTTYGYAHGSANPGSSNIIQKYSFTTDGNATDVADLLASNNGMCGNQA